jgi:hypothetical protein
MMLSGMLSCGSFTAVEKALTGRFNSCFAIMLIILVAFIKIIKMMDFGQKLMELLDQNSSLTPIETIVALNNLGKELDKKLEELKVEPE